MPSEPVKQEKQQNEKANAEEKNMEERVGGGKPNDIGEAQCHQNFLDTEEHRRKHVT